MPLNKDQEQAIVDIKEFMKSDEKFHCLYGGAGSGKSYVINYLDEHMPCTLLATTREASALIGGTTAHSFFGFGIKGYKENQGKYNGYKDYGLIIIDEVSMMPTYIFNYIRDMTSLKVLLCGDENQLVVKAMPVFDMYKKSYLTINMRAKNETIEEIVGYLDDCVDKLEYPQLAEHVGEHMIIYENHMDFLTAIKSSKSTFEVLAYRNYLVDKYIENVGHAKTCFKSQGKTYEEVFIDYTDLISAHTQAKSKFNNPIDIDKYLRMLSVSCSRAQHKIHLFIGNKRWKK